MFSKDEQLIVNKWFPAAVVLALAVIIVLPGGGNFQQSFFLAHDYPFDYKNLMHLYVSESTGRISSLAFISLAPNLILSNLSSIFGVYVQTFLVKITPYFIFSYFYLKYLIKTDFIRLKNWQSCFLLFGFYFLITLGISVQMAINTGLFFNILFQFNLYLFIFHATLYIRDEDVIHQNKFKLLTFLLLDSSILLGSTFIPTTIYLMILYNKSVRTIFNKKYLIQMALILFSIIAVYFLLQIHGISLLKNADENNNLLQNKAYQAIKGGYFYQFIGFSNWGIYTGWSDRLFGGFVHFYNNLIFQLALFSLNALSCFYLYRKKKFALMIILGVFLVLSAGGQPPLGFIYLFLLEHVPGFASIRTPDNKFGLFTQAILLLNLLFVTSGFRMRQKFYVTTLLLVALIFLLPPLITGKTVFGYNSIFSERSTYLLNNSSERQMASKLSSNDFVLLIPGAGNFDHPSGRVGPVDPMPYYIDHYLSYDAVIGDKNSPYASYLTKSIPEIPPDINAVLYRKSFLKFSKFEWAAQGFSMVYEDEFATLYKRHSQPKIQKYKNKYLFYIVCTNIFLYASFFYFLIKYVRSTREI